jgi:hypothetical protein
MQTMGQWLRHSGMALSKFAPSPGMMPQRWVQGRTHTVSGSDWSRHCLLGSDALDGSDQLA